MKIGLLVLSAVILGAGTAFAQVGDLLWEEDFQDLDNWIILTGNGSWGWGNGELEFYSANNVDIVDVPGETGNAALRITARQESGPGIVDQWGNPLNYTSGKLVSKSRVTITYGMIETRVRIPNLNLGGWPAFWLLGTANYNWPRCGEIDMLEMGSKQAFRDLHDTHNGGNGLNNSTVNECVSANLTFYSDDAVTPENPTGAASTSWDPTDIYCRPYYNYDDLIGRFLTYRLYWDDESLRLTVIDGGVERDLYETPFVIGEDSDEFTKPFYLVVNMAIGGAFTDAQILGGGGLPVTMPFPAEMYVDYIRVYEWNGQGEVHLGPPTFEDGAFGIYTDETPVDNELVPQVSSEIYVWEGTLTDASIPPYEGENVLSWQTTGKGWFGAGIMAMQPLNLFNFGSGHLKFRIKIPANVTFKIGIIDSWSNQSYVEFPANTTKYGLTRDGNWGQASIPTSDIRGTLIDLRMLSYAFVILEEHGTACQFAIDDIYWDGGTASVDDGAPSGAALQLHPNVPNPFTGTTEIAFEMPVAGGYELGVYDVAGRRVASFRGTGTAGTNVVRWDGRNERGARVASGAYFCRLEAGGESVDRKLVFLR